MLHYTNFIIFQTREQEQVGTETYFLVEHSISIVDIRSLIRQTEESNWNTGTKISRPNEGNMFQLHVSQYFQHYYTSRNEWTHVQSWILNDFWFFVQYSTNIQNFTLQFLFENKIISFNFYYCKNECSCSVVFASVFLIRIFQVFIFLFFWKRYPRYYFVSRFYKVSF